MYVRGVFVATRQSLIAAAMSRGKLAGEERRLNLVLSWPIPAGHGEPFWRLPFQGDDLTHLGGFGSIARERLADSVVPVSAFDSADADIQSD